MSDKWKHDQWHKDECNQRKAGKREIDNCPYCRIAELEADQKEVNAAFHKQGWNDCKASYDKRIAELEVKLTLAQSALTGDKLELVEKIAELQSQNIKLQESFGRIMDEAEAKLAKAIYDLAGARETAKIAYNDGKKLKAQLSKAHSDIRCMVEKAAAKHRPAYDEQSMKIMKLQSQLADMSLICVDVRKLTNLIVNSPPETPIKGQIESLAFELGHYPYVLNAQEKEKGNDQP